MLRHRRSMTSNSGSESTTNSQSAAEAQFPTNVRLDVHPYGFDIRLSFQLAPSGPRTPTNYPRHEAVLERPRRRRDEEVIPPDWQRGRREYNRTKKQAKIFFVAHGGLNARNIRRCVLPLLSANPPRSYTFSKHITKMAVALNQELMEKLFSISFRDWVYSVFNNNREEFLNVVRNGAELRTWYMIKAGDEAICSHWKRVIGDSLNLDYIFSNGIISHATLQPRIQRQKARLRKLFGFAAELCLSLEIMGPIAIGPNSGIDWRDHMFDVFETAWQHESMLHPNCAVDFHEWERLEALEM